VKQRVIFTVITVLIILIFPYQSTQAQGPTPTPYPSAQENTWKRVVDEDGHFYDGFWYTDYMTGEHLPPIEPDMVGPDITLTSGGSWRIKDHLNFYGQRTYELGSPDITFSPSVSKVRYYFFARMEGVFYNLPQDAYCLSVNAEYDWYNPITSESGTSTDWSVVVILSPSTEWHSILIEHNPPAGTVITKARYRILRSGYQCSNDGTNLLDVNPDLIPGVEAGDLMLDNLLLDNMYIWGLSDPTTPTPTLTPSATKTTIPSRTPTQTSTPRTGLWDTPTPTTTPATETPTPGPAEQFPWNYGQLPTRIPPVVFPTWPSTSVSSFPPTPSWLISLPLIPTPPPLSATATAMPISFTLPLSYYTPAPFWPTPTPTTTGTITPTSTPTATATATPTREDIIGVLDGVSNQLQLEAAAMQTPVTFTISTPPADYAPSLPRNIAAVGWTIENMDSSAGLGFGVTAWASLFGYIVSLPFQIAKMLYNIFNLLGPMRLFIAWLFILLPWVLYVKLFIFIKNLLISMVNLVIKVVQFIGDLWDLIPFG